MAWSEPYWPRLIDSQHCCPAFEFFSVAMGATSPLLVDIELLELPAGLEELVASESPACGPESSPRRDRNADGHLRERIATWAELEALYHPWV